MLLPQNLNMIPSLWALAYACDEWAGAAPDGSLRSTDHQCSLPSSWNEEAYLLSTALLNEKRSKSRHTDALTGSRADALC